MATTETVLIQTPTCTFCRKGGEVAITTEEQAALQSGQFIQQALANREPSFREQIISGTHSECWDAIFGGEEE